MTYCGVKDAVTVGNQDFQASRRDALGGLHLGREEADVGPLLQPRVVRREAPPAAGPGSPFASDGAVGEDGDAQGLLGPAHQQLGELHAGPRRSARSCVERTWFRRLPWPASSRARAYSSRARAVSRLRSAISR